jgi:hypothetical protein
MDCVIIEQREEAAIDQITFKATTAPRAVVIDFAEVLAVFLLEENAAVVIGVDHEYLAAAFCLGGSLLEPFTADVIETDVHPDMTTHFADKLHFILLQSDFSVLLTAGAALVTLVKNRVQGVGIGIVEHDGFRLKGSRNVLGDGC